ncbi:hypothetical protein SKAU_G00351640 [Synaphobranchus kaupii]|uniref:Uncharacterized protein n=1 Tax=Synaphobranchus kaupii TaxID=118154 RepID=A0A9Q1II80_SYNKA|nr:hypothetical protein SKAU_G00351640 [Synaphobranchus kaupii]
MRSRRRKGRFGPYPRWMRPAVWQGGAERRERRGDHQAALGFLLEKETRAVAGRYLQKLEVRGEKGEELTAPSPPTAGVNSPPASTTSDILYKPGPGDKRASLLMLLILTEHIIKTESCLPFRGSVRKDRLRALGKGG